MRIKDQRNLYLLIRDLGHTKVTEMLNRYIFDDDFGFYLEEPEAIIYLSFDGYYNSGTFQSMDDAITGFISSNLDKGKKNFEKKSEKERVNKIVKEAEEETKAHFNIKDEEDGTIPLTQEQIDEYKSIINKCNSK